MPQSNSRSTNLATIPLFSGVPAHLLELITPEMERYYNHDEVIFHELEEPVGLIVLLHGQARILAEDTFLLTRSPYEVVGEQAYIDDVLYSATVIAQGMVKAIVIPRTVVGQLMSDPTFNLNLLRNLSYKLRQSTSERAFRYRNEQLLFSEFRSHLSPEVTQRLLASGTAYGNPRYIDAVILFSDIRSFTERSAGMGSVDIATQLSNYLDGVVDIIHKHEGMVDKFIGDAVMAIWGFASSEGDLVHQALACAEEMVRYGRTMSFGDQPIHIGVGLNAGRVFIGNIGGEGKRQFTVLGTPVNLAARYESQSKILNAPIVLGEAFTERLRPELQKRLITHEHQDIKGAEQQTLYTYDPTLLSTEGELQ